MTGGDYMYIEQDKKTAYIAKPYDHSIDSLNSRLNTNYIYYGNNGSTSYANYSWDLVDATSKDSTSIGKADINHLPEEMKSMNEQERKDYVVQKLVKELK